MDQQLIGKAETILPSWQAFVNIEGRILISRAVQYKYNDPTKGCLSACACNAEGGT